MRSLLLIFIPVILLGCKKKDEALNSGQSFNLHTVVKTSPVSIDTNITFTWDGSVTNSIFTVCVKNSGFANNCEPLGSVHGKSTVSVPLLSLIRQHNSPLFIMGKNEAGLSFSNEVYLPVPNLMNSLIARLASTNPIQNAQFGRSVAINDEGNRVVVGVPFATVSSIDANGFINKYFKAGIAYVYDLVGGVWQLSDELIGKDVMRDQNFGWSVSMNAIGDVIAVGAPNELYTMASNGAEIRTGATHLFSFQNKHWIHAARLIASNSEHNDRFGSAVSLDSVGTKMVISATGESSNSSDAGGSELDNSVPNAGAVYYFSGSGASWSQMQMIKADYPKPEQAFGSAIDLSGDGIILAVGVPFESSAAFGVDDPNMNNETSPNSGAVFVYQMQVSQWFRKAYIKATNAETDDQFGYSVNLNEKGDTLVVGAPFEDSCSIGIATNGLNNNSRDSGAAYLYKYIPRTDNWFESEILKATKINAGDHFGKHVELNAIGDALFVGASNNRSICQGLNGDMNNIGANQYGAVFSYQWKSDHWVSNMFFKPTNPMANAGFGESFAIDSKGQRAIISQPYADIITPDQTTSIYDSGAVYIF